MLRNSPAMRNPRVSKGEPLPLGQNTGRRVIESSLHLKRSVIMNETPRTKLLEDLLAQRILMLDGAMGTMIQSHKLNEADYRGTRFADFPHDLRGNNDLLTLTQPQVIRSIHDAYLEAGADIIETNTFNSNAASMSDYHMQDLVYELNFAGAKLAREAAQAMEAKTPEKSRFVAGVLGLPPKQPLSRQT